MSSADDQLMTRVREGDREAFGELVDRHKDALVSYLCGLTRCRDRAEELAQEAFLRLFQNARAYRGEGRLTAYLFRIATNLLRSEERTSRRRLWLSRMFGVNGHRHDVTPQSRLLSEEATETVSRALAVSRRRAREARTRAREPVLTRVAPGASEAFVARA